MDEQLRNDIRSLVALVKIVEDPEDEFRVKNYLSRGGCWGDEFDQLTLVRDVIERGAFDPVLLVYRLEASLSCNLLGDSLEYVLQFLRNIETYSLHKCNEPNCCF
jgi:hypothetical protein